MKRVILITGASRGIGKDIAETLAKNPDNIIIANYNKSEEKAKELQAKLKEEKINIEIIKADVSKRVEVKKMVEEVLNKYKKIDVVINNAGISESSLFIDATDSIWEKMINNNLYSAYCVTQEALPIMLHRKKGCITDRYIY